jgi:hypothetical protein
VVLSQKTNMGIRASGRASPIDPLGVFCGRGLFGRGSGSSLVSEASGVASFRQACRPLTGVTLAFAFGGLAIRGVLSQQQLAQGLEIAPQDLWPAQTPLEAEDPD